jgi:hypothetical protein
VQVQMPNQVCDLTGSHRITCSTLITHV